MRLVLWHESVVDVGKRDFATDSLEMPAVWLHCCSAPSQGMKVLFGDAMRSVFNFLKIGPKPFLVDLGII